MWGILPWLIGGIGGLLGGLGASRSGALTGQKIEPEAIPTLLPQQIAFQNILMGTLLKSMGLDPNMLFGGRDFWSTIMNVAPPFYPDYSKLFGTASRTGRR